MITTRFRRIFNLVRCLTQLCWRLTRCFGCLNRLYGCPPTGEVAVVKDASVAEGSLMSKPDVSPAIIDKASSSVPAIDSGLKRVYSVGKMFNRLKNLLKGIIFALAPFRRVPFMMYVRRRYRVLAARWRPGASPFTQLVLSMKHVQGF